MLIKLYSELHIVIDSLVELCKEDLEVLDDCVEFLVQGLQQGSDLDIQILLI